MLRKNKIKLIIFVITVALSLSFGLVNFVQGHSPTSMTLNYVAATETLEVSITHTVSNPSTHFVNNVDVFRNNVLNITQSYVSQPTSSTFQYDYVINATAGQTLKVTATCNQGGSITRSVVLTDGFSASPTDNASIGFTCFLLATSFLGFFIIRKRK
ncbi:MAG: hypothetical protein ACTSXA_12595 [Candidatus Heimdallarchaeota archaeon]